MATPAQTSANRTGWSLKKLPTISVPTPSQSRRRGASARRLFYHMERLRASLRPSGGGFVLSERTGELERREGSEELGMHALHMALRIQEEALLVRAPKDVATATA